MESKWRDVAVTSYLKNKYQWARDWLIDLLFPKRCINCGLEGVWLCDHCQKLLTSNKIYRCPVCRQIQVDGQVCALCRDQSYLDGLWVLAHYSNPIIQKIIWLVKYHYVTDLVFCFDRIIKDYFPPVAWQENYVLAPIPLHFKRERQRGFNQAELVAKRVKAIFNNPIEKDILIRQKNNPPQAKLTSGHRLKNVQDIFKINSIKPFDDLKNERVILVDDVYTTGSTMNEAARILKANGFKSVWGLVVARD